MTATYVQEVKERNRFHFGKNWQNFLHDERIAEGEKYLKTMLNVENLVENLVEI
jgi:hypothetical protein